MAIKYAVTIKSNKTILGSHLIMNNMLYYGSFPLRELMRTVKNDFLSHHDFICDITEDEANFLLSENYNSPKVYLFLEKNYPELFL